MRRSKIIEERRKAISPEIRREVNLSFEIVDRIHNILTQRGLKQKDLAMMLNKKKSEISKWMRGTFDSNGRQPSGTDCFFFRPY